MGKFEVIEHPLVQHKLTMIRDKNVGTKFFRETVKEISTLIAYEVSKKLKSKRQSARRLKRNWPARRLPLCQSCGLVWEWLKDSPI